MRILVAQMTRMGDMLQTSTLVRALRLRYPDAHITAMTRNMGKKIAERNPDINDVITYEEDSLYLDLRSGDSDRLLRAYERADAFVKQLADGAYDIVYNCTHSLASAMLFKLAGIPEVVGAHLSDDWRFVLRGQGTTYFFTSVHHREYNDLNLCDLFRCFLPDAPACRQLVFETTEQDRAEAEVLLRESGVDPGDTIVCFQLGASDNEKRWPVEHFAALGKQLARGKNARIVLLGVDSERPLGDAFEHSAPGLAVNLMGRTSVPQVAAVLERANVLVTNDTGTMHIAAAVGCPVALVSVGYVHFRETGPYGEGHCAIEQRRAHAGRSDLMRAGPDERAVITPAQVRYAVDIAWTRGAAEATEGLDSAPELAEVELYVAGFAPDGRLQWRPLLARPLTERDCARMAYRAMWLQVLNNNHDDQAELASMGKALNDYAWDDSVEDMDFSALSDAFGALAEMGDRGARKTQALLSALSTRGQLARAKDMVGELMRLDEETRLFGGMHPACRPLVAITRFERDNLEGADPICLAETTLKIYQDLSRRARLMVGKMGRLTGLIQERTAKEE